MEKHAAIIKPKFDMVLNKLESELLHHGINRMGAISLVLTH